MATLLNEATKCANPGCARVGLGLLQNQVYTHRVQEQRWVQGLAGGVSCLHPMHMPCQHTRLLYNKFCWNPSFAVLALCVGRNKSAWHAGHMHAHSDMDPASAFIHTRVPVVVHCLVRGRNRGGRDWVG
jgi:hypothetical protein